MTTLGTCNVQYANHLLRSRKLVLRADRDNCDDPKAEISALEEEGVLRFRIENDIGIEPMSSIPSAGNKDRIDVYFLSTELNRLISILEPFVLSLKVDFDDSPRATPDPTGMEHPLGIPLGEIFHQYSTNLKARCTANYGGQAFQVTTNAVLYLDPELKRGKKFHMGISMPDIVRMSSDKSNYFEIDIPFREAKRFLMSLKIAKKILV